LFITLETYCIISRQFTSIGHSSNESS